MTDIDSLREDERRASGEPKISAGQKIIDGLKDALAGNLSRVHIPDDTGELQTWVRVFPETKTLTAKNRMTIPPDIKDRVAALERAVPQVPPIFRHLFALLPKPGEEFPESQRLAFLCALASVADVVYGPAALTITLEKDRPND